MSTTANHLQEAISLDYDLVNALESLNRKYGRGKIVGYALDPRNERKPVTGVAYRRVPVTQHTRRLESRRFRVSGNTVRFLRHQCNTETCERYYV